MRRLLVLGALTALIVSPWLAHAQTNALRVLCSNGMRAVVEELKPQLERAAGQPLTIEYGTSAGVRQKIESGAQFDVAVLTVEVIDALAKAARSRRTRSARSGARRSASGCARAPRCRISKQPRA
jgi:ABC-type molybdate transport system substrate-binding protein